MKQINAYQIKELLGRIPVEEKFRRALAESGTNGLLPVCEKCTAHNYHSGLESLYQVT